MTTPVSDLGANAAENIAHAAEVIGRSVHRRLVFDAIYTGKQKSKSVSALMKATKLSNIDVLHAGKNFVDNHIVNKGTKVSGQTTYEKIGFFQQHKKRIPNLAKSPKKLAAYPPSGTPARRPLPLTSRCRPIAHGSSRCRSTT